MKELLLSINRILTMKSRWFKWCIRAIWIFTIGIPVGIILFVYAVRWNPYDLFGEMPSLRQIENPENDRSSELIASDGASLGRYFLEHRSAVSYDDLPEHLVRTLLLSEDHRFHD